MKLETLAIHAGYSPDPTTKAVAVPIYQTSSYQFRDTAHGEALTALAEATKTIAGSQGAMVLHDRKEAQRFLFLEFWDSAESRKAAGAQLPKDVMARIMAAAGGPLKMAGFDRVAG